MKGNGTTKLARDGNNGHNGKDFTAILAATDWDDPASVAATASELGLSDLAKSPRVKLGEAARGRRRLDLADVTALLTEHLLAEDEQVATLQGHAAELLRFLFAEQQKPGVDPSHVLELIERLTKLRESHSRDIRKTSELLARLVRPQPAQVQVLSIGPDEVNIGRRGRRD